MVTLRVRSTGPWHDAWWCRSSRSPTVAPARGARKHDSRRSGARSKPASAASRPTSGARPTARSSAAHDPVVGRGLRRRKIASTTRGRSRGTRRAPPRGRLRGARTGLRAVGRSEGTDDRRGRGADRPSPPTYGARRARLWLCSPDVELLGRLRPASAPVKLVHSDRRRSISAPLERHAYDLASAGIDAMNMHHSEWSAGLVSLFHRFDVQRVRLGHPGGTPPPRRAEDGDRRRLLRPARPHGRDRLANGPPSNALQETESVQRPYADEHAADDRRTPRSGRRSASPPRMLRLSPITQ